MESSSGTGGKKVDPAWEYSYLKNSNDKNTVTCMLCGKDTKGGITRQKQHLIGGYKNVTGCPRVTPEIRSAISDYQMGKRKEKEDRNLLPHFGRQRTQTYVDLDEENEDAFNEMEEMGTFVTRGGRGGGSGRGSNTSGSGSGSGRPPRAKGPMDAFFTPDPVEVVSDRKGKKLKQTTIDNRYKKEERAKVAQHIARWFYQAGIPFNTTRLDSYRVMMEAVGQFGPGLDPPSYHELRVPLLRKEVEYTQSMMAHHKDAWALYGCSLMSDGWTDRRGRTLINFLVNSSAGTYFLESVDASSYVKTGTMLMEMLDHMIQKVGVANVVQVVTDNAANYVLAGKMLEVKYPTLFWTPCAAHCIDLILHDIGKLSIVKKTLKKAISLNGYIYNHPFVLNMMRAFTKQRELIRPAVTRFATAFLTLQSLHNHKNSLRAMFCSEEWMNSRYHRDTGGRVAYETVMQTSFWTSIVYVMKATGPIVRVLRMVDSEKKPAMGYIYEAMDRAKEAIKTAFNDNEAKYRDIWNIIDARWDVQLHQPLHAAGYYLNPEFFYTTPEIESIEELNNGLITTIERLVPDIRLQDRIHQELNIFRNAAGLMGTSTAIRHRTTTAPATWWKSFGSPCPNLQKLAIRILSLTCSSSGCERNWSAFEHIHTKRRNRLEQKRLNDLVFVRYNQILHHRYQIRDSIDPITLKDIDESNEWLTGRMDSLDMGDDEGGDPDLVFDGEDLDWAVVSEAMGVDEPRARTRGASASSSTSAAARQRRQSQLEEEIIYEDDDDDVEEEEFVGGDTDEEVNEPTYDNDSP